MIARWKLWSSMDSDGITRMYSDIFLFQSSLLIRLPRSEQSEVGDMLWKPNDFREWLERRNEGGRQRGLISLKWVRTNILHILKQRLPTSKKSIEESVDTIPSRKVRFEVILELSDKHDPISLCTFANVSVSGYYQHKHTSFSREQREVKEKEESEFIRDISAGLKHRYGYRTVVMKLARRDICMNHKKVLRLMRKYNLLSQARRRNPYKTLQKATQEHRTAPNILNRSFWSDIPYCKLGTDVTYLPYKDRWSYLSAVKDMASWEILSHHVSLHPDLSLVRCTFEKLEGNIPEDRLSWAIVQSDQGFQYTHPSHSKQLRKLGCVQSMSRKGNCLDNAPTESFFWHMKDEIDTSECETFEELEKYVDSYIHYYNNDRPQWTRKKMTPVEYRNHLLQPQS